MMNRLMVPLLQDERQALLALADRERRDPRQQAAILIRQELERLGLVPSPQPLDVASANDGQAKGRAEQT